MNTDNKLKTNNQKNVFNKSPTIKENNGTQNINYINNYPDQKESDKNGARMIIIICLFIISIITIYIIYIRSFNRHDSISDSNEKFDNIFRDYTHRKDITFRDVVDNSVIIKCKLASYDEKKIYLGDVIEDEKPTESITPDCLDNFKYVEDNNKIAPISKHIEFTDKESLDISFAFEHYIQAFHYPTLDIKMVNNSDETIVLDEIVLDVEKSTLNEKPLIYIHTDFWDNFKLHFENLGYGKWDKSSINLNLNKTENALGDNSKNKEYKYNFQIPYFDDYYSVDLKDVLISEDIDVNLLEENYLIQRNPEENNIFYKYIFKEYFEYMKYDQYNIYYMPLDGRIDINNSLEKNSTNLDGIIALNRPYLGGIETITDKVDIELKESGENYKINYPISVSLKPNEVERFYLTLSSTKTSNHLFKIDFKNINNVNIESDEIDLDIFAPKTTNY